MLMLYASLLILVFFIDLEHNLVLNKVVYPAIPVALLLAPLGPPGWSPDGIGGVSAYLTALEGGGFALLLFLLLFVVSRGGMGAGDVKLSLLLGLMLGLPLTIIALPLAFITGGITAVLLVALRRKGMKSTMPFAPFLSGGALFVLFWGEPLLNWYLGLFGL